MRIAKFVFGKGGSSGAAGEVSGREAAAFLQQRQAAGGEESDGRVEFDFIYGCAIGGGHDPQAGGIHRGEGEDVALGGIGQRGCADCGIKHGPDAGPCGGGGGGVWLGGELDRVESGCAVGEVAGGVAAKGEAIHRDGRAAEADASERIRRGTEPTEGVRVKPVVEVRDAVIRIVWIHVLGKGGACGGQVIWSKAAAFRFEREATGDGDGEGTRCTVHGVGERVEAEAHRGGIEISTAHSRAAERATCGTGAARAGEIHEPVVRREIEAGVRGGVEGGHERGAVDGEEEIGRGGVIAAHQHACGARTWAADAGCEADTKGAALPRLQRIGGEVKRCELGGIRADAGKPVEYKGAGAGVGEGEGLHRSGIRECAADVAHATVRDDGADGLLQRELRLAEIEFQFINGSAARCDKTQAGGCDGREGEEVPTRRCAEMIAACALIIEQAERGPTRIRRAGIGTRDVRVLHRVAAQRAVGKIVSIVATEGDAVDRAALSECDASEGRSRVADPTGGIAIAAVV